MFEKPATVKSFDKALEVQTEYAKSSYETFVAESKKIGELYTDLAKDAGKGSSSSSGDKASWLAASTELKLRRQTWNPV
jgi:hypothetical protein